MENDCFFCKFKAELCQYLTGNLSGVDLIRKSRHKFQTAVDLSIPLYKSAWLKHCGDTSHHQTEPCSLSTRKICKNKFSSILLETISSDVNDQPKVEVEEAIKQLILKSTFWCLRISQITLQHNRICLRLDRAHIFQVAIEGTLKNCDSDLYQQRMTLCDDIDHNDQSSMNLSQLRVHLLKKVIGNLLTARCCTVSNNSWSATRTENVGVYLTTSSCGEIPPDHIRVLCGVVVSLQHGNKETGVGAQQYLRLRQTDMLSVAEHKYEATSSGRSPLLMELAEAAVKLDLLQVKPSHIVSLNLAADSLGCREASSKGAAFVLYNCARLSTLLVQFVASEMYPPLTPLAEVDFSLLTKQEEWDLVWNFVVEYPDLLRSCIVGLERGKPSPHLLCNFVSSLCSCFSVYYSRVHILTGPRSHLLPVMFARLYLLKTLQGVLHSALSLLDIAPVGRM